MNSRRIRLINCDENILIAILKGDSFLAKELDITIPDKWTVFGGPAFRYSLEKIKANSDSKIWWTYLPVIIESNTLIGSCGYKGPPDENGMVEIGYEVAEEYRNQGYATEITNLLVKNAFENTEVKKIFAHTLADKNASVKVLKKNDFKFVEETNDEEEGKIWKWVRRKNQ